jgi:hypothetical protein
MVLTDGPGRYWNPVGTAPAGVALRLRVSDGSGETYVLPSPCRLTPAGWVNAATGAALTVHPTHWQLHVETLPSRRAWVRRLAKSSKWSSHRDCAGELRQIQERVLTVSLPKVDHSNITISRLTLEWGRPNFDPLSIGTCARHSTAPRASPAR